MANYFVKTVLNRTRCNINYQKFHKVKVLHLSTLDEIVKEIELSRKTISEGTEKCRTKHSQAYSLKHYNEISKYISSNNHDVPNWKFLIPAHYLLRKFIRPNSMFMIDSNVANKLFEILEPYLKSEKSHIIEVNAGIGLLTKNLLNAKIPRLRIYETDSELYTHLNIINEGAFMVVLKKMHYSTEPNDIKTAIEEHGHKVLINKQSYSDAKLYRANLLLLWNMIKRDRNDFVNRFNNAFDGIQCCLWDDEPVMKIIVTIPSEGFLLHIMYSIIFQSGICIYGRPELFLIMPSSTYYKLVAKPEDGILYRSKSVLFHLLFEHVVLSKLPAKACVPWLTKKRGHAKESNYDPDINYLVKVTARQDLFKRVPAHLLKPLWFFIHSMMRKKNSTLISNLENWMPGSGPRLIYQRYTIYSKCGSLTPEEYLKVFLEFASWPDFKSSSFLSSMENVLMKMMESGVVEELLLEEIKNAKPKNDSTNEENNEKNNYTNDLR